MLESNLDALFHWQLLGREYIEVSIDRVIDHQLHSSLFERRIPVHWKIKERKNKISLINISAKTKVNVTFKYDTDMQRKAHIFYCNDRLNVLFLIAAGISFFFFFFALQTKLKTDKTKPTKSHYHCWKCTYIQCKLWLCYCIPARELINRKKKIIFE